MYCLGEAVTLRKRENVIKGGFHIEREKSDMP